MVSKKGYFLKGKKIVKRNPHVFGAKKAKTLKEAIEAKQKAKKEWKQNR